MTTGIGLLVAGPILAAAVALAFHRIGAVRDSVTVGTLTVLTGLAAWLLVDVNANGTAVLYMGGWDPHIGITLVADVLAALILVVALATILLSLVASGGYLINDLLDLHADRRRRIAPSPHEVDDIDLDVESGPAWERI